jgi:hypothetical protein
MKKALLLVCVLLLFATVAAQQGGSVKVSPNGVNVNANGATVVFLTFGGLTNHRPAEACWCGELISAAPARGSKCNPATLFGCLPERYDLSTASGNRSFTDIMSIPPSVSRRAYQAVETGQTSSFFYVRRFISTKGGPDEYVAVTCRMASGGVSTPLALTDVKLLFGKDQPVLFVKPGETPQPIRAEIAYNGTGRLKGRWEVVKPGDELPSLRDLLTEGSLPVEERGSQRHYTQLSAFNVFLPPAGKFMLEGPEPSRLPTSTEGPYIVLLRVEVTDDKDGGSSLSAAAGGKGFVNSGAVAGFPLPVLRYFVGAGTVVPSVDSGSTLALVTPADHSSIHPGKLIDFVWSENDSATVYRLEVQDAQGVTVLAALMQRGTRVYNAPPWIADKAADGVLRWRVVGLNEIGAEVAQSVWRTLKILK